MAPLVKEIASGLRFPEGPIAMPDGSFLLVEVERQCLSRISAAGDVTVVAHTGGGPNGAAIGPDGACYIANSGGFAWHEDANGLRTNGEPADYRGGRIERVDLDTGKVERLFDRTEHGTLRGPNDLVFDRHGGFWFTDHGKTRARDMDRGGVYYAKADGSSIKEVVFPFVSPNGIALSPDGNTLYVAETIGGRLWSYPIKAPGELVMTPWPLSPNGGRLMAGSGHQFQMFDSIAVDAAGNVCVATLMNGGISVVPPEGGAMDFIAMPDPLTTNICFGGPGLKTAYLTLSFTGKLVAIDWPQPGAKLNFLNE